jgi:PKD repeat protein
MDGIEKWSFATGNDVFSSPVISSDGTLYVGSKDNNLYAIHTSSMGLADSPWPKFHQNNQNTGLYKATMSANFAADRTSGTIPFTVQFTDSSQGSITNWLWDFGDGKKSLQQNPVHTYETVSVFSMSLTVSGPGGSDTKTRTNYIVTQYPVGVVEGKNS